MNFFIQWNEFLFRPAPFSIKHTLDENSFHCFDLGLCRNMKICIQMVVLFYFIYSCTLSIGHMLSLAPFIHKLISGNLLKMEKDPSHIHKSSSFSNCMEWEVGIEFGKLITYLDKNSNFIEN